MSAILSLAAAHYTRMQNNAALNMINMNNARMNLIGGLNDTTGGIGFGSLEGLCAADTEMELSALTSSIQYAMAKAMLEQIKKQQKEDAKRFSIFA